MPEVDSDRDDRIVLTLDAGGTNFVFAAMQGNRRIGTPVRLASEARNLERSLENIKKGFRALIEETGQAPAAISFAFPGPADYPRGIIDNVGNLPAYAGGVPLADILQDEFGVPVFINNDGDLFVYGEAVAGLLPQVNEALAKAGSPKKFRNLFGVTLGTGFGGGLVMNGLLYIGDNSNALEVWLMNNKLHPGTFAEEGACIRAIQKTYAREAGLPEATHLSARDIEEIALGKREGDSRAAREAYREMGRLLGDVFATAATLFDTLIVIGGGLAYGHRLFMDSVLEEMNGTIRSYDGRELPRLVQKAFDLEDPSQMENFLLGDERRLIVPGSGREVIYDPRKRIGIGITRLGTSEAVAVGAYAYALRAIDCAMR